MFCASCGNQLGPEAAFCANCGTHREVSGSGGPSTGDPTVPQFIAPPPASADPTTVAPSAGAWTPPGATKGPSPTIVAPPPGGYAPAGGTTLTGETPAAKRGLGRWIAVVAGVFVLAGAAYFVSQAIGGEGGGADSPEAAVQDLADSISMEDPAGAANALAPDEARTLGDLIATVEGRARKSGLAAKSKTYSGLDVQIEDLDLKVKELADGVARVEINAAEPPGR